MKESTLLEMQNKIKALTNIVKNMARQTISLYQNKTRRKRPGVHAKSKTSSLKSSINYKKKYRGQGR